MCLNQGCHYIDCSDTLGLSTHGCLIWTTPTWPDLVQSYKEHEALSLFCIPQYCSQIDMGSTKLVFLHHSFYLIYILSHRVTITDTIHHKTLLRVHMVEIKNQHLSRPIASNQVLTIPLNISRFCISTTKLKFFFSSNCVLNPG